MDTLTFGYILPTTGRIPDLHRLETCAPDAQEKTHCPHSTMCYENSAFYVSNDNNIQL